MTVITRRPPPVLGPPYTTTFPFTENPMRESGVWLEGLSDGLDWGDVQTVPGHAYGTTISVYPTDLNDSTAILKGSWPANQTVQSTLITGNRQNGTIYEEVEHRLRSTLSAHSSTGYEITFSLRNDGSQYIQVNRWDGPLNGFVLLHSMTTPPILANGDVLKSSISGTLITIYRNGSSIDTYDTSGDAIIYSTGNPGMGFYMQGGTLGELSDYGFSAYSATSP